MPSWKKVFRTAALNAEERFDQLRYNLKERLGRLGPVQIVPYRGFGTADDLFLQGRVLEDKGLDKPIDNDSVWRNLLAMYRRFESDEIPGARLQARFQDVVQETVTDGEGYFEFHVSPSAPLPPDRFWHPVTLTLLDRIAGGDEPVRAEAPVLVPPPDSSFGVISDIDDTVIKTQVTNLLRMAQITFLNSARTRLPFKGVAGFYRALQAGPDGNWHNPAFYVSSSPWNLYDLLIQFFELQDIPLGPLLLRDLGLSRSHFIQSGHRQHKLAQIERVLACYPDLPFVLVGDSGQKDPEIYQQVVHDFPDRVLVIYIRDVSKRARDAEVQAIAEDMQRASCPMLLVKDTEAAARDAIERGLIRPAALPEVQEEKAKDSGAPNEVEQLFGIGS